MKDHVVLKWARKLLEALPEEWRPKRMPYKAEEALDAVVEGWNRALSYIQHQEDQTREEMAVALDESVKKTLKEASEQMAAKDATIEDLRQKLDDADKDIAQLRNDVRHLGG